MLSNQCEMDGFFSISHTITKLHINHRFVPIHSILASHCAYSQENTIHCGFFSLCKFDIILFSMENTLHYICAISIQLIKWMCSATEKINWFSVTIWLWIMTMKFAFIQNRNWKYILNVFTRIKYSSVFFALFIRFDNLHLNFHLSSVYNLSNHSVCVCVC